MSRKELLIALWKSKQRHGELCKSKDSNTEIEETKNISMNQETSFQKKIKKVKNFVLEKVLASI